MDHRDALDRLLDHALCTPRGARYGPTPGEGVRVFLVRSAGFATNSIDLQWEMRRHLQCKALTWRRKNRGRKINGKQSRHQRAKQWKQLKTRTRYLCRVVTESRSFGAERASRCLADLSPSRERSAFGRSCNVRGLAPDTHAQIFATSISANTPKWRARARTKIANRRGCEIRESGAGAEADGSFDVDVVCSRRGGRLNHVGASHYSS